MLDLHVLKLFNAMVAVPIKGFNLNNTGNGFVTNFDPTPGQLKILREEFKPLPLTTLFSVMERQNASVEELIVKQILHYIEVYGLGEPGLFRLEQTNGKVATIAFIAGITIEELGERVRKLLYTNAPVKDAVALKEIISGYRIDYDLDKIQNNEMRMLLFRVDKDVFPNGDDTVRYMCYVATESALLIKSKKVIQAIEKNGDVFSTAFFNRHAEVLAKVFHRHKNLILAAKTKANCGAINRISRMAKTLHVPVHEPFSKRVVSEYCAGRVKGSLVDALERVSLRDKFKLLNLLSYKAEGNTTDAFVIRNGKVHLEENRPVMPQAYVDDMTQAVLQSLKQSLGHLISSSILLDPNVDYGLPVSRKQVIGQLPFGTTVTVNGDTISSGVYWEDKWGASDLDLSAVDVGGRRVGWGQISGYTDRDIVFSGDVVHAANGAMEFMTSSVKNPAVYALFLNIFRGNYEATTFELVVGSKSNRWIESPVLREKGELQSRGNIIGFVKNGKFVVYLCRMNGNYWSAGSKEAAIVARGAADFWTVRKLLDYVGIPYSVGKKEGVVYTHDLSYQGFSLDKLEALFQ